VNFYRALASEGFTPTLTVEFSRPFPDQS